MITDHDRSGWFGASDTAQIMRSWDTDTFRRWWSDKLGLQPRKYSSRSMYAGTYYEHRILDAVGVTQRDRQILLPELRLRVNLDGEDASGVVEVKTYKAVKEFKPTSAYRQQVNVQMYARRIADGAPERGRIVAYGLTDEDYADFFRPVELARIQWHEIEYDALFIERYLERLKRLRDALERGAWPT